MIINVAGLLKSPTGETRTTDIGEMIDVDDEHVSVVAPVRGRVQLIREPNGILVTGHLSTCLATRCARCLRKLEVAVGFDLAETFTPTVQIPGGPQAPEDADDVDTATLIDGQHVLDLTEVVRQAVVLAVPFNPLCRQDCPGLCTTCGRDLNEGTCECEPARDPRWDVLRDLVDDD